MRAFTSRVRGTNPAYAASGEDIETEKREAPTILYWVPACSAHSAFASEHDHDATLRKHDAILDPMLRQNLRRVGSSASF